MADSQDCKGIEALLESKFVVGIAVIIIAIRIGKNLKNANLNLIKKFEFFWGLVSKNLNLFSINNPQIFILNLKNSVLIPASKFKVFWGLS